ncbi:hypothetical protein ABW20_dc0109140 [Dactylellina cionopaga]|nr:hypothetical protein ABW20_dc0109140 [Dactylellina cionopaga]
MLLFNDIDCSSYPRILHWFLSCLSYLCYFDTYSVPAYHPKIFVGAPYPSNSPSINKSLIFQHFYLPYLQHVDTKPASASEGTESTTPSTISPSKTVQVDASSTASSHPASETDTDNSDDLHNFGPSDWTPYQLLFGTVVIVGAVVWYIRKRRSTEKESSEALMKDY